MDTRVRIQLIGLVVPHMKFDSNIFLGTLGNAEALSIKTSCPRVMLKLLRNFFLINTLWAINVIPKTDLLLLSDLLSSQATLGDSVSHI